MNLVLFDLGGTLIDDPFEQVLQRLYNECLNDHQTFSLEKEDLPDFFGYWREENFKIDYPFASHFLQEESWLIRSLMRLNLVKGAPRLVDIPLISLALLKRYREIAQIQICSQPQLPFLRKTLAWLKRRGTVIGVASNDREYATKTVLIWAAMIEYFDWIFTSEGLSKKYPGAEKPRTEFFRAVFNEIGRPLDEWDHIIYLGDSEKNDILPARSMGLYTIRYLNKYSPQNAVWIDSTTETVADHRCSDRKHLLRIFREILNK